MADRSNAKLKAPINPSKKARIFSFSTSLGSRPARYRIAG
jgi:hypothetical protein